MMYIGIPYSDEGHDLNGCSCWGLIRLFFNREYGIELSDLKKEPKEVNRHEWEKIELGNEDIGDILLFRAEPYDRHVGVVFSKGKMLHTTKELNSVIESFHRLKWKNRLLGIYRCKALHK